MATSKNISGSDEIRYQSYLNQMEREQDANIKDKKDEHKEKLTHLISNNTNQADTMRKDYDVKISGEAETLERKLNLIRDRNSLLINQERELGEREAEKMRTGYQNKVDQEKKIGDNQLSKLQQYYRKASEELANQFSNLTEKEKSKAERNK